jgi:YHS domain-containing protein
MTTRRHLLAALGAFPMGLALAIPARAQTAPVYAEDGIAIDGTDPVSYFAEGRPVAGSPDYETAWRGAVWRFASEANRAAFEADPEAYAPQYGGWCAWAVADGYTASTVPDAWKIVDGRLYLNFSRGVQRRWERDIPGNIARGDANWPGVLG